MRFEVLNEAFANNSDFQQSLACYYADILQFHKEACVFVRRNSKSIIRFVSDRYRTIEMFEKLCPIIIAYDLS